MREIAHKLADRLAFNPQTAGRLSRFAVVGVVSNLCVLLLFMILLRAGIGAVPSSIIVYAISVIGTYLINRKWSFASTVPFGMGLVRYIGAHVVGAGISASFQYIFHEQLGYSALLVQCAATIIVAMLTFLILHNSIFKSESGSPQPGPAAADSAKQTAA